MSKIKDLLVEFGENPDQQHTTTDIAGLQYYKYYETDELSEQKLRPQPGDRIQFVRNPDNSYDSNAIEIWFKNGQHMLGHIPYRLARKLAPLMDEGKILKGYFLNSGDGTSWSVSALLLGPALPSPEEMRDFDFDEWERHNKRINGEWVPYD